MVFEYLSRLFPEPKEQKKERMYGITTNGEKFLIYTRDNPRELNSLRGLDNGWRLIKWGPLRADPSTVFEVEESLNGLRSGAKQVRDEILRKLGERYQFASQESRSDCADVLARVCKIPEDPKLLEETRRALSGAVMVLEGN